MDIPSVLQINSDDSVLEGNNIQLTTSIYPYLDGQYTWSIESGRVGCSIDQNGLLITEETALDTSDVVIKVIFVANDGEVLTATKILSVIRRTYPQNIIINGATDPRESAEYTWSHDTEEVNGNYSVVWSLEDNITSYWHIKSSDSQSCVLEKTGAIPSSISGIIKVSIVRNFDNSVASIGTLALSLPVVFPENVTIIGNVNPLESPYTYTWETTTEGVNGEFYAEWALSGDVTSVVEIASYDNDSCVMRMLDAVTELIDGLLTLNIRKSYDGTLVVSATKELQAMLEGIIITNRTNPIIQAALFSSGLVVNETYTLKEEAELITASQLKDALTNISTNDKKTILQFDEFQYFTGITEILSKTFYNFSKLTSIVIPESVTTLGGEAFSNCTSLKNISLPDNITHIPYRCFYYCTSLEWIKFPANLASVDATSGGVPFYKCNALTSLYGAKVEQERYLILDGKLYLAVGADNMVIPESVTSLAYGILFQGTSSSTVITLHEDIILEKDGYHFSECMGECIVHCQLPNDVYRENDSPFEGNAFRKITVGVKNIPKYAFGNCSKLEELVLEEGVESFEDYVVRNSELLQNIFIPRSLKAMNGILVYVSSSNKPHTNVYYSGVLSEFIAISRSSSKYSSIAPGSYDLYLEGELLTVLNIPEGVTDLPYKAFGQCISISEVILPQSLKTIGDSAFYNCSKIKKITSYNSTAPTLKWYALNGVGADFALEGTNVLIIPFPSTGYDVGDWANLQSSYGFTFRSYEPTECTSLSIVADDVIGQQTTTTIRWTAVTNGYSILTGTFNQDVTVSGVATSAIFPQNISETDSIERTIEFTYLDVTATTTITQGPWIPSAYTIDLNDGQWEKSDTPVNPDSTMYDGVYRSVKSYNVNNGCDIMYINIVGFSNFKLYIRSYAESNYDYVMVSQLNKTITGSTSYSSSDVKAHTRGKQQGGTAISSYTLVEFTNIDVNASHRITILYRKDGSGNTADDRGYVLIPKNQ